MRCSIFFKTMIPKPQLQDLKNIGYYSGKIIIGMGLTMSVPMVIGLLFAEINPALDFLLAFEITLIFGLILTKLCFTEEHLSWVQGMIVASLSWVIVMLLGAIPLYLSGHWNSYLDACFELMSGFTTTGLTLVQDLDHLSSAHNLWRHFSMFIGGQGIVVISLIFLVRGSAGAFRIYAGEGREEKLLPNVVETARSIFVISMVYLIVGTLALWIAGISEGMPLRAALFNGACIFMAAFSTGGFTPYSQNILYYHSFIYEVITIVILIIGAMNFNLHYTIWFRRRKEMVTNIEARVFFLSVMLTFLLMGAGLAKLGVYHGASMLFRKGFYHLISGHTTTGFATVYARQFINEWGEIAVVMLTIAMGLGACACSTGGGIKMLRIGIVFKAFKEDLKRIILPDKAITIDKFHHIRDIFLEDKQVRSVLLITLSYLVLYVLGALIGILAGYPFLEALFESTSAAANAGLSCGITQATMPVALKLTYIFQMWIGRLEFMSVFALIGFIIAAIKGK